MIRGFISIEKIQNPNLKRYVKGKVFFKSTIYENELGYLTKCLNIPILGYYIVKLRYGKSAIGME